MALNFWYTTISNFYGEIEKYKCYDMNRPPPVALIIANLLLNFHMEISLSTYVTAAILYSIAVLMTYVSLWLIGCIPYLV